MFLGVYGGQNAGVTGPPGPPGPPGRPGLDQLELCLKGLTVVIVKITVWMVTLKQMNIEKH